MKNINHLKESITDYMYWENDLMRTINQLQMVSVIDVENMESDMLKEYNRCNKRIELLEKKLDNIVCFASTYHEISTNDFIHFVNTRTENNK